MDFCLLLPAMLCRQIEVDLHRPALLELWLKGKVSEQDGDYCSRITLLLL